jgi:hypothetical protein
MNRNEAIALIKSHEAELRAAGIAALYLFGSTARDDASDASDIDLACEIDGTSQLDLFKFAGLRNRLQQGCGSVIDLVPLRSMRPFVKERAMRDMIRIY